jgi:uncharacterized protein with NRDE domain
MCTLLFATGHWLGTPLLVASNRDEMLERESQAPSLRERGGRRIFAPRDLRAGGTWMGVNDAGVFVAITNRFNAAEVPTAPGNKASRGRLVDEALSHGDAAAASQHIAAIDPDAYNGFHLLCADIRGAWVTWSDTQRLGREELRPGIHVLTERSYGAAPSGREQWLGALARQLEAESEPTTARFRAALSVHHEQPLESTCVHFEPLGYGTRSSSIVCFDDAGPSTYHYAAGPPCRHEYQDLSEAMIRGLRGGATTTPRVPRR